MSLMELWLKRLALSFALLAPGLTVVFVIDDSVSFDGDVLFLLTMGVALAAGLIADRVVYGPVMDRPRPQDRER